MFLAGNGRGTGQDGDLPPAGTLPHRKNREPWRNNVANGTAVMGRRDRRLKRSLVGRQNCTWLIPPGRDVLNRMVTGGLASVNVENFSSHESRRIQVHHRINDIRHFSHSTHRVQRCQSMIGLDRMHRRLDDSR